jgi:hypothetical protein
MNRIRQFCAATVLTLSIAFTCFAGEMHTGIADPPPEQRTSVEGYIDTPTINGYETSNSEMAATGSVTELALYLFDSMMYSVF